jgi:hypothetical protein
MYDKDTKEGTGFCFIRDSNPIELVHVRPFSGRDPNNSIVLFKNMSIVLSSIPKATNLKKFLVPFTIQQSGDYEILAPTAEDAIEISRYLPLPEEMSYMSDSYEVYEDAVEEIEEEKHP